MDIYLSPYQIDKIRKSKESVNVRIDRTKKPNTHLPFIPKTNKNGTITLNKNQVGGFLPLLASAAVPFVAGYLGRSLAAQGGAGMKVPNK